MIRVNTVTVVDGNSLWVQVPKAILSKRDTRSTRFDAVKRGRNTVDLVFGQDGYRVHTDGRTKLPASLWGIDTNQFVNFSATTFDGGIRLRRLS